MGIGEIEIRFGFGELALVSSMEPNECLQALEWPDRIINGDRIEKTVAEHYHFMLSNEGADV